MYGEFSECSNIGGFEEDDEDGTERESDGKGSETDDSTSGKRNSSISFQHWCRQDKRVTKATLIVDIEDAADRWQQTITELKKHIHRKRIQVAKFNRQKSNLEENKGLIQCDYSENYKNSEQDEVQSAYLRHASFSIFTACAYFRLNEELIKHPMTIVSEASDQCFMCFNKVVGSIRSKMAEPLRKIFV